MIRVIRVIRVIRRQWHTSLAPFTGSITTPLTPASRPILFGSKQCCVVLHARATTTRAHNHKQQRRTRASMTRNDPVCKTGSSLCARPDSSLLVYGNGMGFSEGKPTSFLRLHALVDFSTCVSSPGTTHNCERGQSSTEGREGPYLLSPSPLQFPTETHSSSSVSLLAASAHVSRCQYCTIERDSSGRLRVGTRVV